MQIKTNNYLVNIHDDEAYLAESEVIELVKRLFLKLDDSQQLLSSQTFDLIELELSLLNNEDMQEINKTQRQKDYATDVLSFPSQDNIRADEFEVLGGTLYLGDILICHQICEKQANEHDITYKDEFIHLLVHGILHLYGYDHEIDKDEDILMRSLEDKMIKLLI